MKEEIPKIKCPHCKKKFSVEDLENIFYTKGVEDTIKAMEDIAWDYRLCKSEKANAIRNSKRMFK